MNTYTNALLGFNTDIHPIVHNNEFDNMPNKQFAQWLIFIDKIYRMNDEINDLLQTGALPSEIDD